MVTDGCDIQSHGTRPIVMTDHDTYFHNIRAGCSLRVAICGSLVMNTFFSKSIRRNSHGTRIAFI